MNQVLIGGFTYGDVASNLIVTLKNSGGTAIDLTGASEFALACNAIDGSDSFTINGSVYGTATNGQMLFEGLATSGASPRKGRKVYYTARASWIASGASAASIARTDYRFWVEEFSASAGAQLVVPPTLDLHRLMFEAPFTIHNDDQMEIWYNNSAASLNALFPDVASPFSYNGLLRRGSHIQVDTGVGSDKCVWVKEEPERTVYPHGAFTLNSATQEQVFRLSHTVSCWVCPTTKTNATATMFVGIGLGGPANSGAFPFDETNTGENPCLQLRLRLDTMTFEAAIWNGRGESSPPAVAALSGVTAAEQYKGSHLKIVWNASNPAAPTASFYVDGVLGYFEDAPSILPEVNPTVNVQAHIAGNWFVSSGSHASGHNLSQVGPFLVTRPRLQADERQAYAG